jgi:glycine oxidase
VTLADIAVVGGGLLGRSLVWRAARAGARVALYDAAGSKAEESAAWAAAGMIAPITEAIDADVQIASMGRHSLTLWPQWLADLPVPVFYRASGTILLWHREDSSEAVRAEQRLASRVPQAGWVPIENAQLRELEPALNSRLSHAAYISGEAQVDNREFLEAVGLALGETRVECHWNTFVSDHALPKAGVVIDCRGMGAKSNWHNLRGVRGEIVRLYAPDIELHHMLRLLHPRYPVYIVPRAEGRLVVGATSVESDDRSPVCVRGALELLASAQSVLPALAEARILEFNTQVRPAFPDNLPAIRFDRERRVLQINGLYRHGFLLTPTIVEDVLVLLSLQDPMSVESWTSLRYHDEVHECLFL